MLGPFPCLTNSQSTFSAGINSQDRIRHTPGTPMKPNAVTADVSEVIYCFVSSRLVGSDLITWPVSPEDSGPRGRPP